MLSEALKTNRTLSSLSLESDMYYIFWQLISQNGVVYVSSGNYVGDEGAAALSEALVLNTTLTSLNLWSLFHWVVLFLMLNTEV